MAISLLHAVFGILELNPTDPHALKCAPVELPDVHFLFHSRHGPNIHPCLLLSVRSPARAPHIMPHIVCYFILAIAHTFPQETLFRAARASRRSLDVRFRAYCFQLHLLVRSVALGGV